MTKRLDRFVFGSLAAAATLYATPASAGTGCNGVINIFVWGCAPWDNNNGPKHAYYRKKAVVIPTAGTRIIEKNGVKMALRNGVHYPLIGQDGAGLIQDGAGWLIGQDGAGLRVWSQ